MKSSRFTLGDGLRGIAAIGVVVFHSKLQLPFVEVNRYWPDFFFVLSGLVLTKYFEPKQTVASWVRFAAKRVVRFYPLVLVAVALFLLLALVQTRIGSSNQWPVQLGLGNVLLAAALLQLFSASATLVLMPYWSLSGELFVNLAAYWPVRKFGPKALWFFAVAAMVVEAIGLPNYWLGHGDPIEMITGFVSFARVIAGFSLGVLLAKNPPAKVGSVHLAVAVVLMAALIVMPTSPVRVMLAPWAFAAALRCVLPLEERFAKTRFTKVAEFLGTSSFGIYVWHPVFHPMTYSIALHLGAKIPLPTSVIDFSLLITVALLFTRLGYHFIEKPTMRWVNARTKIEAVVNGAG